MSKITNLFTAAKLTFGSKKVKFGVGFESGIAKGSAPDTNLNVEAHANNNHASAEMSIRNKTENKVKTKTDLNKFFMLKFSHIYYMVKHDVIL